MPRIQSLYASGKLPAPISQGADVVALHYECAVPASGDGTVVNDLIEMGPLPAGHVPLDFILSATDLDTGAAAHAVSFGLLNAGKTDLSTDAADGGAVWASAVVVGQAGTMVRNTGVVPFAVLPSTANRSLAFKVTTASATKAAGTIRCTVFVKAAP